MAAPVVGTAALVGLDEPTICACATATGGHASLIRLSGPRAFAIAGIAGLRGAGITGRLSAEAGAGGCAGGDDGGEGDERHGPARVAEVAWPLAGGACPCRVACFRAPRSATGCDLVEIVLPGSADLVELALASLLAAGAEPAAPGAFTRQALAHARLTLDQAEAVLAITHAADAAGAAHALARLREGLGLELAQVRERLLRARALVESGLDFLDEADVRAYDPSSLRAELAGVTTTLARWRVAATATEGTPVACLVGPANAGKSALFARLTGAPALVSPIPGTTRDALEADLVVDGRRIRLIDTAGWLDAIHRPSDQESPVRQLGDPEPSRRHPTRDPSDHAAIDRAAVAAGRAVISGSALVIACSAPDAPLPATHGLPTARMLLIATKSDLGPPDPLSALAVSAVTGEGITELLAAIASRLASASGGEPRQQRLLANCLAITSRLAATLPPDELLAEDLRAAAALLGDLIGATTPDDILAEIFSKFCIGK